MMSTFHLKTKVILNGFDPIFCVKLNLFWQPSGQSDLDLEKSILDMLHFVFNSLRTLSLVIQNQCVYKSVLCLQLTNNFTLLHYASPPKKNLNQSFVFCHLQNIYLQYFLQIYEQNVTKISGCLVFIAMIQQ